jgi:hypothetical protein
LEFGTSALDETVAFHHLMHTVDTYGVLSSGLFMMCPSLNHPSKAEILAMNLDDINKARGRSRCNLVTTGHDDKRVKGPEIDLKTFRRDKQDIKNPRHSAILHGDRHNLQYLSTMQGIPNKHQPLCARQKMVESRSELM